jgi:predicted MFS family arabinose efflux permease
MTLKPYRQALAIPGLRSLLIISLIARLPATAASVTLTLHVVEDLGRGYAAAGMVGAAATIGASFGAPVMGRIIDRHGLRPVLLLTTVAELLFWSTAQALPYPFLLVAAVVGGFMALPVFSVVRQSIAALTPVDHRRAAYALDSMAVELSFMTGPALAVLMVTTTSARATMFAVGGGMVLAGLAMLVLNPPVRAHDDPAPTSTRLPRRSWLTTRMVVVLAVTMATTVVLGGTDVAVVAVLRESGQLQWTGAVLAIWGGYSMLGGFAYGTLHRPVSPVALLALLAAFTIPVGLGGGSWWLLALALLPAGALCAPTLTATADAMSRLAPAGARGEAMGLHNSSLTVGIAVGAPLAGAVMDGSAPAWGFAATGGLAILVVLVALPAELRHRRAGRETAPETAPEPSAIAVPMVDEAAAERVAPLSLEPASTR